MSRHRAIYVLIASVVLGLVAFWVVPHYRGFLYEAMSTACSNNNLPRVQLLIRLGADPDGTSDYDGPFEFTSHVMVAATHPDCRILRYLLSKGARPDIHEGDGSTPLSSAINDHNVEAVRVLLAAGANPRYTATWTAADQARVRGFPDLIDIVKPYLKP